MGRAALISYSNGLKLKPGIRRQNFSLPSCFLSRYHITATEVKLGRLRRCQWIWTLVSLLTHGCSTYRACFNSLVLWGFCRDWRAKEYCKNHTTQQTAWKRFLLEKAASERGREERGREERRKGGTGRERGRKRKSAGSDDADFIGVWSKCTLNGGNTSHQPLGMTCPIGL